MLSIRIFTLSLVMFLSIILLTGTICSYLYSYTYGQEQPQQSNQQLPSSIIAVSSTDTTPHVLKLKATQQGEDGQPKKVSGFKIGLTNVVTAQINSPIHIFVTDSSLHVIGAKVRTVSGQLIDIVPSTGQTNAFLLENLPAGVYTLDVITQKGNTKAAYEGILVLGQEPTNPETQTIIEQQVIKAELDDGDDGDDGDKKDGRDNGDKKDNGDDGDKKDGRDDGDKKDNGDDGDKKDGRDNGDKKDNGDDGDKKDGRDNGDDGDDGDSDSGDGGNEGEGDGGDGDEGEDE
jgi:hypothetical protein